MTGTAEQSFDRAKALTDPPRLLDPPSGGGPARGAWVRPCGTPGPYAVRRPTPTMPNRLQVLTCTRPETHGGPFHQAADERSVVIAQWGRDGKPDWPPIMQPRRENASDVPV